MARLEQVPGRGRAQWLLLQLMDKAFLLVSETIGLAGQQQIPLLIVCHEQEMHNCSHLFLWSQQYRVFAGNRHLVHQLPVCLVLQKCNMPTFEASGKVFILLIFQT